MYISYGGVVLEVAHGLRWDREPVYDGPTFLYQLHTIRARCYYNPGATSYTLAGSPPAEVKEQLQSTVRGAGVGAPNAAAAAAAGQRQPATVPSAAAGGTRARAVPVPLLATAPVTDISLRHILSQPRQQLVVGVGTVESLRSPRKGFTVDSHNGPKPIQWDVVQISGTKTFIVDFAIQVALNECYLFNTKAPSVLLSHRWQMMGETDQDGYTTRYIQGRAVFNTEKLLAVGGQADDFRDALFHPVPMNFRRGDIKTYPSEDGSECAYTLVDREMPINYLVGGVRIECFKYSRTVRPGAIAIAQGAARGAVRFGAQGAGAGGVAGPWGAGIGGIIGAAGGAVVEGAIASIPMQEIGVTVRVWGNADKQRKRLEALAINMAGQLFAQAGLLFRVTATTSAELVHDIMGRFVEFKATVLRGLPPLNLLIEPLINLPDLTGSFAEDDGVKDITTAEDADNPPPVGFLEPGQRTRFSRGTYVGTLVAQALQAPCAASGTPGDPPKAVVRVVPSGQVKKV